ncbi:MAG: hypothetical protein PHU01_15730, partial [Desulfuromonadaceae bacterium]|nr:hypothetical protein [Desulfuromonadaceae bacterium]
RGMASRTAAGVAVTKEIRDFLHISRTLNGGGGRVSCKGHGYMSGGYMKKGDLVKFRNIVDAGDEDIRMILLEDPDGGRVLVESIVDMNIRPTHRYSVEDLEICINSSHLK